MASAPIACFVCGDEFLLLLVLITIAGVARQELMCRACLARWTR